MAEKPFWALKPVALQAFPSAKYNLRMTSDSYEHWGIASNRSDLGVQDGSMGL